MALAAPSEPGLLPDVGTMASPGTVTSDNCAAVGILFGLGPPSAAISVSDIFPARLWMLLHHHSRRSSWSPSAKMVAVGCSARRGLSRPWGAVQLSWKMPSTNLVTTGGTADS